MGFTSEEAAQRGCGDSVLGNTHNSGGRSPGQNALWLLLLRAGGLTGRSLETPSGHNRTAVP